MLSRESYGYGKFPEKIIQFGEGNFLRCFIDWQIDILNEKTNFNSGITLIRPINSDYMPPIDVQDGLYTALIRGLDEKGNLKNEARVVSSVNREILMYKDFDSYLNLAKNPELRWVFSNTTEAGINFDSGDKFEDRPQNSFPGKLTRLLFERFDCFKGEREKGLIIVPCELIDYNGEKLKEYVVKYAKLWNLGESFIQWLEEANTWCSTLVDRIVTGYPKDEIEEVTKQLGYEDKFITTGEYFYLFVIQGPQWLEKELKLNKVNLNIKIVDDIKPYKMRKVGILNGAHTAMVPVSYLYGLRTVRDTVEHEELGKFVKDIIFDEIIPALDMDKKELVEFADAVINRFKNPFIKHQLISISLNSMFKYKTRILPQLISYREKTGELPKKMVFALASLICFYSGEVDGEKIPLSDDKEFLDFYSETWAKYDSTLEGAEKLGEKVLELKNHWEVNLNEIKGLKVLLGKYIYEIKNTGMKAAIKEVI